MNSPNLITFFNSSGRYLCGVIALGSDKAGTPTFYKIFKDNTEISTSIDNTETLELDFPSSSSNTDSDNSAQDKLDHLINILEKDSSEKDNLVQTVSQLCCSFMEDVCKRMDTQYLYCWVKKVFYYLFRYHL